MYSMSAQVVRDSVDKYRDGVLIGNFVEDQFGKDLALKGPDPNSKKVSTSKSDYSLPNTLYNQNEILKNIQTVNRSIYQTAKEKSNQDYNRPQKITTYNIFNQPSAPNNFSCLQNNPKKQEYLDQHNNQLYDQTRYLLSNKFESKQSLISKTVHKQIPDILTGQILRPKKQIIIENKNEYKKLSTKLDSSITPKIINPYSTYSLIKSHIKTLEEIEYKNLVLTKSKGVKRDLLFGHGLALDDFQKRQFRASDNFSCKNIIKPRTPNYGQDKEILSDAMWKFQRKLKQRRQSLGSNLKRKSPRQ